jgi:hypothetical protein
MVSSSVTSFQEALCSAVVAIGPDSCFNVHRGKVPIKVFLPPSHGSTGAELSACGSTFNVVDSRGARFRGDPSVILRCKHEPTHLHEHVDKVARLAGLLPSGSTYHDLPIHKFLVDMGRGEQLWAFVLPRHSDDVNNSVGLVEDEDDVVLYADLLEQPVDDDLCVNDLSELPEPPELPELPVNDMAVSVDVDDMCLTGSDSDDDFMAIFSLQEHVEKSLDELASTSAMNVLEARTRSFTQASGRSRD